MTFHDHRKGIRCRNRRGRSYWQRIGISGRTSRELVHGTQLGGRRVEPEIATACMPFRPLGQVGRAICGRMGAGTRRGCRCHQPGRALGRLPLYPVESSRDPRVARRFDASPRGSNCPQRKTASNLASIQHSHNLQTLARSADGRNRRGDRSNPGGQRRLLR